MSQTQSLPAWKEEINARLTAHRTRQTAPEAAELLGAHALESHNGPSAVKPSASRIAARVAERYAKAPSYSEMLAQEAAKAAEAAAQAAQQAHVAAQAMLASFEQSVTQSMVQSPAQNSPQSFGQAWLAPAYAEPESAPAAQESWIGQPEQTGQAGRMGRWAETAAAPYEEAALLAESAPAVPANPIAANTLAASAVADETSYASSAHRPAYHVDADSLPPAPRTPAEAYPNYRRDHGRGYEEERPEDSFYAPHFDAQHAAELNLFTDPVEAATIEPAQPLPARIIEFPRELVAERKARPRLEEGPLREIEEEQPQLRIFEAEPEAATYQPTQHAAATETLFAPALPEWPSLEHDSQPEVATAAAVAAPQADSLDVSHLLLDTPIYCASIEDRLMAGIVDLCLVGAGWLAFVAAFAGFTQHLVVGKALLGITAAVLLGMFAFYQFLFLSFSDATPGMRYAKLALCTFHDQNPSRKRRRRRAAALLLAALPAGLGFLWPLFDQDRLGWHDRITRTYQRSYRD